MTFFIPGNPEEEGPFTEGDPPPPDGNIESNYVVDIQKAEFVQTDSGYRLDLKFSDHYYRQTQNAIYSLSTNPTGTGGKLQAPSQLPSYTIRLLKKTVPVGGVSQYSDIRSLWQPYGNFNTQNFINADIDFDAYGYGVGITPYSFWYPTMSQQYGSIAQVDPTGETGVFDFSFDSNGGVKYNNSPNFTNSFPSGPNDNYGTPSRTTPLQQFISGRNASSRGSGILGGAFFHVLPRWKYCRAYDEGNLFTEPGAYLIAITRNAIDNSYASSFISSPGNPIFWSVDLSHSKPNVSLAYLRIEPPPLSPITIANDILSFEVASYGSVSPSATANSSGQVKFALQNVNGDTPTFAILSPATTVSQSHLTYDPANKANASVSIVVNTSKDNIAISQAGSGVIDVRGLFAYDFRLASEPNIGFMPYAVKADIDGGYVNYPPPIFGVSSISANIVPNFSADWIPLIRSQVPQLTFDNSKSFGTSETITKYTDEFQVNPYVPPDGPIISQSPVIINEAKFTSNGFGSYYLDLTFTDSHYKNNQRGAYAMFMAAQGTGKLQAPNQLPPYVIRVFKKTAPILGKSNSNKVQSLWQPLHSFNSKSFIASTDGGSESFDNNNIGIGLTPYYYYFTGETLSYDHIGQVDATGGTGKVSVRLNASGGAQYLNPLPNIGYDSYYSGTHHGNNVSNMTPLQQVVASAEGITNVHDTQKIFGPSYRSCAPLVTGPLFNEPGAYLVVITRNAIESSFSPSVNDFRGVPSFWSVSNDSSLSAPSVSSAFLTIDPPLPSLLQTNNNQTLQFTVNGYGSVNVVETISTSPPEYRWAITNKFAGTPGFSTPNMPYDINTLSLSKPQGDYNDFDFVPSPREQAYQTLETRTDINALRIAEQSISAFDVRGAFLYDFRVTNDVPYFNPYADQAAVEGYTNYTTSNGAQLDSKLKPNFGQTWIVQLRGTNGLSISDSTVYVPPSSSGQAVVLSQVDNFYVTTGTSATLQASIDIPVQLNASIIEITNQGTSPRYTISLSWEETQSSIITSNIVGTGHVIRIYRRSNTAQSYEGSEFTNNPVTYYKYNSITDTGAPVPSSAVTTTNGNKKNYDVRAGKTTLYTGAVDGQQTWTEQDLFGSWMIVLQRNFTPAGATTPTLVTSCAVTTLPDPPRPLITVVLNEYGWPGVLTTSISDIPLQNITSSFVNVHWSKQDSSGNYQAIPPGANYTQNVDTLGNLPASVKVKADMTFVLNADRIVERLGSSLVLTIADPNFNNSGFTGPRSINQASAENYSLESLPTNVSPLNIQPTTITVTNHEIANSNTYLFKMSWDEQDQRKLTINFVGAKNVLRVFKYENDGTGYKFAPVPYAKYISQYNTGINLSSALMSNDSVERVIYLDKLGNVSTSADNLASNGFSEDEMNGNWLFILQRNFSTTNNLLLVTQGCYYIQLPPPSLRLVVNDNTDGTSGLTEELITSPVDMFAGTNKVHNEWSARVIDPSNSTFDVIARTSDGGNALSGFTTLPLTELRPNDYWPLSKGPSEIKNKVTIDNLIGVNSSSYPETLGQLGEFTATDIAYFIPESSLVTVSGNSTTYKYEGTTNTERIYEPVQTNNSQYYLKNVSYSYKKVEVSNNTNTYIEVLFTDPNTSVLNENEAYIVNIFEKGYGTNATSQWSSHPKLGLAGEIITKGEVPDANEVTTANGANDSSYSRNLAIRIFANAVNNKHTQIIKQAVPTSVPTPTGGIGSFDPGAYLIVIRRTSNSTGGLPFYSINSGFVFIAPPTLTLSNSLVLRTPIYGSYDSTGTPNVTVTPFVTLEGVEEPEPFAVTNVVRTTPLTDGNGVVDSVEFDIDEDALKTAYPDSGPIVTATRVNYDWSAPSSFDLDIGKIGGNFQSAEPSPTTQTKDENTEIMISPNQAVSNNVRILMPSNSLWNYEQGNIVRDARASFIGDANNRLLAIRWEDMKPSDLQSDYTGSPYALRLYKKRRDGATASERWYDPSNDYYGGMYPYYERAVSDASNNNKPYAGVAVRDTYLSESDLPRNALNKSIMYIYADASGHIWYNSPPTKQQTENTDSYRPFTDADDSGGYVLVIQRNFELTFEEISGSVTKQFISTVGTYLHLMPVVSWGLELENNGSTLFSNPDPNNEGIQDFAYSWNLALPNISYSNLIPGENSARFDVGTFKAEFRNRDKSAVITSKVTYNFSVTELPFMEAYPLQYIGGNGFFTATSQDFIVDLCVKPTEFPPPPWPRFSLPCPDVTPEERAALQMRRKAETLMHVSNKHERRMTKAQQYSFIARGFNQKRQTYATQTDKFTNPNTKGYPVLGNGLALPTECGQRVLTFPSSASDVPGPVVPLTYDPNVPLINYKVVRTYNNSQTEFYDEKGL